MKLPNPLIPGFHPDPSVVRVGPDYHLVTSTFEYLPGIAIHHSTDLEDWTLVGHVITRPEQFDARDVRTGAGAWAPTIRWHEGRYHVIVAMAGAGTRVYVAEDPAGPWSDGTLIEGLDGIDPDLAWDEDGTCYVTYSALLLRETVVSHLGIQQVRVDLDAGRMLETPRPVWSGTGLMFPEAPHLYRIGQWWYLMIAEGGTERGHAVSIARSARPDGPFEGCPQNPILSARSTDRPVQNTGHGDLVVAPDGSWSMVMLGMRTRGMTRSFSAMGRETFGTDVDWVDGWPVVEPVELSRDLDGPVVVDDFGAPPLDPEWIAVRRHPADFATIAPGRLVLCGEGATMDDVLPTFVGRRQSRPDARIAVRVADAAAGIGGLSLRYDEHHHVDIEVSASGITGRAVLPGIRQEVTAALLTGPLDLVFEIEPVPRRGEELPWRDDMFRASGDVIRLVVCGADGERIVLMSVDGRHLSAETVCSFTGRVVGPYCVQGELTFTSFSQSPVGSAEATCP